MKDSLLHAVKSFFSLHYKNGRPVLLGLSGGVDSLALLHLILECKTFFPIDLHLAHLDHAWREESKAEAAKLQKNAESLGLAFHYKRLDKSSGENDSNLEEKGRQERISFFKAIYANIQAQALILAHQQNDQAETILKRIFEGAGLFSLGGMRPISQLEGMVVWRPLLNLEKNDLHKWLKDRHLTPFYDQTNSDPRFLRARMRETMIPNLEAAFGKKIARNLCQIAEDAYHCKQVFDEKFHLCLDKVKKGLFASWIEWKNLPLAKPFEKWQFLKFLLNREEMLPSRDVLYLMASHLEKGSTNKVFWVSGKEILIDRSRLVLFHKSPPEFIWKEKMRGREYERSGWKWRITARNEKLLKDAASRNDVFFWEKSLSGKSSLLIPYDSDFEIVSYHQAGSKAQKQLASILSQNKIPSRFKSFFPLIVKNNELSGEIAFKNICFENDLICINVKIFEN
jgi:tRNA(Ile)-lysidine synthase